MSRADWRLDVVSGLSSTGSQNLRHTERWNSNKREIVVDGAGWVSDPCSEHGAADQDEGEFTESIAFRVWPARRVCFGLLSEDLSWQMEFALRFALGGVLGAMVGPLALQLWSHHLQLSSSAAAVWCVFTTYDSLGESVKLALAGVWGSAVGTLSAYVCWQVLTQT